MVTPDDHGRYGDATCCGSLNYDVADGTDGTLLTTVCPYLVVIKCRIKIQVY